MLLLATHLMGLTASIANPLMLIATSVSMLFSSSTPARVQLMLPHLGLWEQRRLASR